MAEHDDTGKTVALVGGAGLFAWWLLSRGKGWGLGGRGRTNGGARESADTARPPARCKVWIRANRIEVDGAVADLPTVITKCRAAGEAEVHATGDAIVRVIREVLTDLHTARVKVYTASDLARIVPSESLP